MWSINGQPKIIKTVATMNVGEKGMILADGILTSTKGELCINLDAYIYDIEDYEYENIVPIWDEEFLEEFIIKRTSEEENGYEIDIDEKRIKPTNEKTFNTKKSTENYISLWIIPNFQKLLQETLMTNMEKNTRTLEAFSKLTEEERNKLTKGNLEVLLNLAEEQEKFEIAGKINNILKKQFP